MQAILHERSGLMQAALVPLAGFFTLTALCLVLAYWTWIWLAPRPEPRLESPTPVAGRVEAARNLFGTALRTPGSTVQAGIAIRVLGVVAASAGRIGHAVLRIDAKRTVAVREGGEVDAGVRLIEVRPDHVVIERAGVRETLAMDWNRKSAAAPSTVR